MKASETKTISDDAWKNYSALKKEKIKSSFWHFFIKTI